MNTLILFAAVIVVAIAIAPPTIEEQPGQTERFQHVFGVQHQEDGQSPDQRVDEVVESWRQLFESANDEDRVKTLEMFNRKIKSLSGPAKKALDEILHMLATDQPNIQKAIDDVKQENRLTPLDSRKIDSTVKDLTAFVKDNRIAGYDGELPRPIHGTKHFQPGQTDLFNDVFQRAKDDSPFQTPEERVEAVVESWRHLYESANDEDRVKELELLKAKIMSLTPKARQALDQFFFMLANDQIDGGEMAKKWKETKTDLGISRPVERALEQTKQELANFVQDGKALYDGEEAK